VHRDVKLENVLVASQKRAYAGGPLLYTVACQICRELKILEKDALYCNVSCNTGGVWGIFCEDFGVS